MLSAFRFGCQTSSTFCHCWLTDGDNDDMVVKIRQLSLTDSVTVTTTQCPTHPSSRCIMHVALTRSECRSKRPHSPTNRFHLVPYYHTGDSVRAGVNGIVDSSPGLPFDSMTPWVVLRHPENAYLGLFSRLSYIAERDNNLNRISADENAQ